MIEKQTKNFRKLNSTSRKNTFKENWKSGEKWTTILEVQKVISLTFVLSYSAWKQNKEWNAWLSCQAEIIIFVVINYHSNKKDLSLNAGESI